MELQSVIEFLTQQRDVLDETIALLERLHAGGLQAPLSARLSKRRGRKFMAPEDREKVSARMKEYWQARRSQKTQMAGG